MEKVPSNWKFYIDKGGTFTDILGINGQGEIFVHKILSQLEKKEDPTIVGIKDILSFIPSKKNNIKEIRIGTTIGTNALLERKGAKTAFLVTEGFADLLEIGYQQRPDIFDLHIKKHEQLYDQVVEVKERIYADGSIHIPLNKEDILNKLSALEKMGIESLSVALLHSLKNPKHELEVAELAKTFNFKNISLSHFFPVPKIVPRGDTTTVDAYLSPIIKKYGQSLEKYFQGTSLFFMQSNGGLVKTDSSSGAGSVLSGPVGGIVGAVSIGKKLGLNKIIGFDMGGTSTDVFHFAGEFENSYEKILSGIRICTPMLDINTLAAGGGSIIRFADRRLQVGPESAGAFPGPSSYGWEGPLAITDCNLLLGRIIPDFFPKTFGKDRKGVLNKKVVKNNFEDLAQKVNKSLEDPTLKKDIFKLAEAYLEVANQNMALGLKKITTERGIDLKDHVLVSYGGAGGQHACDVADLLSIGKILAHPQSSVLSSYGLLQASISKKTKKVINKIFNDFESSALETIYRELEKDITNFMANQGVLKERIKYIRKIFLRFEDTFSVMELPYSPDKSILKDFNKLHLKEFGFSPANASVVIDSLLVEGLEIKETGEMSESFTSIKDLDRFKGEIAGHKVFWRGKWYQCPITPMEKFLTGKKENGPLILASSTTIIFVTPNWEITKLSGGEFLLEKKSRQIKKIISSPEHADPLYLELFNNRFRSIAERMGVALQKNALSINIKERLDYSCAIFDDKGELISNAPHIPVHLGSIAECIKSVITKFRGKMKEGDSYLHNDPYTGGTHLPDLTVVTPLFLDNKNNPAYYLASRGHHADIGGKHPGSMPMDAKSILEEGVLFKGFKIVGEGIFKESKLLKLLLEGPYPARNPKANMADLKAQISANHLGIKELKLLIEEYGEKTVEAYSQHIQKNAADSVKSIISTIKKSSVEVPMDNGSNIKLSIFQEDEKLHIDFSGTSPERQDIYNTPFAVTKAAIFYVIRCLIGRNIPLNSGCFRHLEINIPEKSLLAPTFPLPVAAGNVETSQIIVDALLAALGIQAASQGSMNNLLMGNNNFQYYETICG
ncbi:MAG: 5-oxoprolinase, partial [Deltaproteobacteria bacterium]